MLSRISEALGCPTSKDYSSNDSSAPEGDNWLSQSTRDSTLFVIPTPNLREILQTMGITRCGSTGQFYFDQLPSDTRKEQNNPWAVAHSSRQRCKLVESLLSQTNIQCTKLIAELRCLAMNLDENVVSGSATFIDLLIPLLTEEPKPGDVGAMNDTPDDVLILFGSPATIFQLLLSVPSLNAQLTDLILELVASSSPHSVRLLEQLKQPVGLTTMFSSKKAFEETATRLLELFQVVTEPTIQASILNILPDLASSPCTLNGALTDEDRLLLIEKLLELLATIPTSTVQTSADQVDPVACLIECLTSFSVDRELANRLPNALFELLDRCYTPEEYYAYLPLVTRSLLIHGPAMPRNTAELSKLIQRLRNYFTFPKKYIELTGDSLECALIDLLRVAFQFNRQLMTEWMRVMNTSSVVHLEATEEDLQAFHDQASQDFLVLCIIYSVVQIHTTGTTTLGPLGGSSNTGILSLGSSTESGTGPSNRLQSEVATIARRLVISGRLFPVRLRAKTLDSFVTCHSALLLNPHHRLFSAFVYLAGQLISTPSANIRSPVAFDSDSSTREVGSAMLTGLFQSSACEFAQRQEIVIHLVRHSLSALPDPAKSSRTRRSTTNKQKAITRIGLLALLRLAQSRPHDLARFETILFGLLDRLFQFVIAYTNTTTTETGSFVSDHAFDSLKETARLIFLILAWVAFCDREQKSLQEKLLSILRKQLSNTCLFSKALGVIGSVVVLETICRRHTSDSLEPDGAGLVLMSTQYDDSIVLASQLTHVEHERVSTSTTSTSRTSNTSCLSLRGPGTALADDPDEIHVPVDDTEENLDDDRGRTRNSDSVLASGGPIDRMHIPPSRLLLQLIGLVEHTTAPHSQLFAFWLDELCSCFTRLFQIEARKDTGAALTTTAIQACRLSPAKTPSKNLFSIPSNVQANRLLAWMGARVMRDFQDNFVVDNALQDGYQCQLNLNDPSMCEIAIAMGPTWHQYRTGMREQSAGSTASRATKVTRVPNPFLLPAQLKLIGITQKARNHGRLDAIDALLGCPILLPTDSTDSLAPPQKPLLSFTSREDDEVPLLLCAINWCLEVVNVFSWHVITADCVTDNASNSYSMPCSVILARLTNIAHLRQQLYTYLRELETLGRRMFETADDVDNGRTLSDLCLPTVTFEPGKLYTTHLHSTRAPKPGDPMSHQRCFTCGVHFESLSKRILCTTRKTTDLKGCKSKCAIASSEPKTSVRTVKSQAKKRRTTEPMNSDEGDQHRSLTGSVHTSSEPEDCEDEESLSQQTDDSENEEETVVEGKLIAVGGNKNRKNNKNAASKFRTAGLRRMKNPLTLSPDLEQLTACFRELDLAGLVLGLSAWPWHCEVTATGVTTYPASVAADPLSTTTLEQQITFDWVTLSWLVEDLRMKLEHLSEPSPSTPTGWYAFECLDSLEPEVRSKLLLHIVPHLQRVLHLALSYLKENPTTFGDANSLSTSSSSSSSEDETEQQQAPEAVNCSRPADATILRHHQSQPRTSSTEQSPLPNRVRKLISNVVCSCLSSLCILCHGSANPISSISDQKAAVTEPFSGWTTFNLDCVCRVADACRSSSALSCASFPGQVCVRDLTPGQKVFVDVVLRDHPSKLCYSFDHVETDSKKLARNICTILRWLFEKSSPDGGLPNSVAALFHCRFSSRLVDLFTCCMTSCSVAAGGGDTMSNANGLPEDDFRVPMDLFHNTEMLLDQQWDSTVRWKNISYRDSIQGILAQHLRLTPSPTTTMYTDPDSSEWLSPNHVLEFTRGLLLPRLRTYKGEMDTDNSPSICLSRAGYSTLNRFTAELYCREVMNAVLWYMRRLSATGTNSKAYDENLLLSGWNECIVILCLLVDLVRPATQRPRRPTDRDDVVEPATLPELLPSLMRTGRTFLEGLLKGAMPLLSTLFRYRGLEVTTLLRNTQSLTRFLQRVCTHAKAYRNARLANQIPATRRCLETFVYRVKTMLSQNQCAEAFWLGTLKNRDLHGVEIQDDSLLSRRSSSLGSHATRNSRPAARNRPSSSSQSLRCADDEPGLMTSDGEDSDASSSSSTTTTSTTTGRSDSVQLRHVTIDLVRNDALIEENEEDNDLIIAVAEADPEEEGDETADDDDDGVIEPSDEEQEEY